MAERPEAPEVPKPRKTFGPVVLVGLVSGAAAAVAGSKSWVAGSSGAFDSSAESSQAIAGGSTGGASTSPLALALALVLLACWGVVLVTRGRFRRLVTVLGLVAALGMVAATVEAFWSLPTKLADTLVEMSGTNTASTHFTGWYYVALVAGLLCVATTLAAVRLVPTWPEMGTKYDAPTGAHGAGGDAAGEVPSDNIDIWKALDEGRDPTA